MENTFDYAAFITGALVYGTPALGRPFDDFYVALVGAMVQGTIPLNALWRRPD
jgi:hypothetical protein